MMNENWMFGLVAKGVMYKGLVSYGRKFAMLLAIMACSALAACTGSSPTAGLSSAANTNGGVEETQLGDLRLVTQLPAPAGAESGTQNIAPNDLLEIKVFQVADLDRTVRVDDRGQISMPLIGQVNAAGQTSLQLERSIQARYAQNYLQNPVVTVFVKESSAQSVTMDGQFMKPGIYPVATQSTLMRSIALAGGLTNTADENKIYVFRKTGNETLVASFSAAAIRNGQAPDPRVYGGDVVVSFLSSGKVAMQNLREALGLAVSVRGVAGL